MYTRRHCEALSRVFCVTTKGQGGCEGKGEQIWKGVSYTNLNYIINNLCSIVTELFHFDLYFGTTLSLVLMHKACYNDYYRHEELSVYPKTCGGRTNALFCNLIAEGEAKMRIKK